MLSGASQGMTLKLRCEDRKAATTFIIYLEFLEENSMEKDALNERYYILENCLRGTRMKSRQGMLPGFFPPNSYNGGAGGPRQKARGGNSV